MIVHVLYIGISKAMCKNKINTLQFGLNIAFSKCQNPLPKSAIEIWGFSGKVIWIFSKICHYLFLLPRLGKITPKSGHQRTTRTNK